MHTLDEIKRIYATKIYAIMYTAPKKTKRREAAFGFLVRITSKRSAEQTMSAKHEFASQPEGVGGADKSAKHGFASL